MNQQQEQPQNKQKKLAQHQGKSRHLFRPPNNSQDPHSVHYHSEQSPSPRPEVVENSLTSRLSSWRYVYMLHLYRHILLCLLWGSISLVIGISLVTLSAIIRSKTTSLVLLESLPVYIPGLVLCFNGLLMLIFMFSKTRRFALLKFTFALYLLSIILLTVIIFSEWSVHLRKLAKHRFCVYHQQFRQCACTQSNTYLTSNIDSLSKPLDSSFTTAIQTLTFSTSSLTTTLTSNDHSNDQYLADGSPGTSQIVFDNIDNCQYVHGILNDSLRVILGLTIVAIPVSLFSIWTLFRLHRYQYSKQFFAKQQQKQNFSHNSQSFQQHRIQSLYQIPTESNDSSQNLPAAPKTQPTVNDCLSPNFSSRDHLIMDGHFRSRDFEGAHEDRSRIWSSQFSGFSQNCDARSESGKISLKYRLRRVVSVMFDQKSRQNWSRWNLFRRKNSSLTDSASTKRHHQSQILLPPPHASRLFALNNNNNSNDNNLAEYSTQNCAPLGHFSGDNLHRSFVYLSTSPSSSGSSSASSSASLSSKTRTSFTSRIPNTDAFPVDCPMQETNFNEPANPSLADDEEPDDLAAVKWTLTELTPEPEVDGISAEFHEEFHQEFAQHPVKTEYHSSYKQERKQRHSEPEVNFEHLIMSEQLSAPELKLGVFDNISAPLVTPILISEHVDEYFTTFEEAFKNYYDSQHRISEYQFHTLPLNKSRTKAKAKRKIRDDIKLVMPVMSDDEFPPIEPPADYQNQAFLGSTIPVDILPGETTVGTSFGEQQFEAETVPEILDPNHDQQQDWFYRIMAEMDRIQKDQMNDMNLNAQQFQQFVNEFSVEGRNKVEGFDNDNDDDDGEDQDGEEDDDDEDYDDDDDENDEAGDTSTSQDIAEFELELDEESLKVSEELNSVQERKYMKQSNSVIQTVPDVISEQKLKQQPSQQQFQQQSFQQQRFQMNTEQYGTNPKTNHHYFEPQNRLCLPFSSKQQRPDENITLQRYQQLQNGFQHVKPPLRPLILDGIDYNQKNYLDNQTADDEKLQKSKLNKTNIEINTEEAVNRKETGNETVQMPTRNTGIMDYDIANKDDDSLTETESDPESIQDSSSLTAGYVAPPKPFTSYL